MKITKILKVRLAMHVIVFCPNPYSNYTISVIELLFRKKIKVDAVICRSLLNLERFTKEYSKNGSQFLFKIFRKLILRSSENPSKKDQENIKKFMQENSIYYKSIYSLAKKYSFEIFKVSDFDNSSVIESLQKYAPDCCVFTGGGVISSPVIKLSGIGIINCHMGILPFYRGMDVVEWPLLDKRFDLVGITTHLMENSIDTGPIIDVLKVDSISCKTIGALRNYVESLMPVFMVESCWKLLNGKVLCRQQDVESGKLHFKLCPSLRAMAENNLARR
jgi:methionyl-tRNA formyltransferase